MPHDVPQVCLPSASTATTESLAAKVVQASRGGSDATSVVDRAFDGLFTATQLTVSASADWRAQHGLILSSSAVAIAEDYIRSILTELVSICPLAATRSGHLSTRLEFVFSGSVGDAVRAVLDRESFSSSSTVDTWLKQIAGAPAKSNRALQVALSEFERVCHIRHCAMHSGGYVSAYNAATLGVRAGSWISFDSPDAVHEIIAVVASTIRALNQHLFEAVISGWITEGTLRGTWETDRELFTPLWATFHSAVDYESSRLRGDRVIRGRSYDAYRTVHAALRARYAAA